MNLRLGVDSSQLNGASFSPDTVLTTELMMDSLPSSSSVWPVLRFFPLQHRPRKVLWPVSFLLGLVACLCNQLFSPPDLPVPLFDVLYPALACALALYGWGSFGATLCGALVYFAYSQTAWLHGISGFAALASLTAGYTAAAALAAFSMRAAIKSAVELNEKTGFVMWRRFVFLGCGLGAACIALAGWGAQSLLWPTLVSAPSWVAGLGAALSILAIAPLWWVRTVGRHAFQGAREPSIKVYGVLLAGLLLILVVGTVWLPAVYVLLVPLLVAVALSTSPFFFGVLSVLPVIPVIASGAGYVPSVPALSLTGQISADLGLLIVLLLTTQGIGVASLGRLLELRNFRLSMYRDPVTGLMNQPGLQREFDFWQKKERNFALAAVHVDLFDSVLRMFGPDAGDALVRAVAARIENELPLGWPAARLLGGGYVFMIPLNEPLSLVEFERIARSLQSVTFAWRDLHLDVRCRAALLRRLSGAFDVCVSQVVAASRDMDADIQEGPITAEVASAEQQDELYWLAQMQRALVSDRFVLFAQKIAPLQGVDPSMHFEVLVRMRAEDGSLVPPNCFIPVAERFRFMPQIDVWIVEHVLSWLALHPEIESQISQCSINLSGITVANANIVDIVRRALIRYPVDPKRLCFEITETAALGNLGHARSVVEGLRNLGCKTALDDFGRGLATFEYLKHLPVDVVKIDGSFIQHLELESVDHSIVRAVADVARFMGIQTVAEYVETDEVRGYLADTGIDFVQGYGIERPMPIEAFFAQERDRIFLAQ